MYFGYREHPHLINVASDRNRKYWAEVNYTEGLTMTINKALITIAEADTTLALDQAWLDLDDDVKTQNIGLASTYVQLSWSCTGIDWDDTDNLPDEIKEATAYYAQISSQGMLYQDSASGPSEGMLIEETNKLGSLESTKKWSQDKVDGVDFDPTQYPDALMGYYCTGVSGGGSVKAVRT